jgi:hypothetical protein
MDYQTALQDGYSQDEVLAELGRRTGMNYQQALSDGYSIDEVLEEMNRRETAKIKPKAETENPSFIKDFALPVARDVGGLATMMGGGLVKGATLGVIDPLQGTVGIPFTSMKTKYAPPLKESLESLGVKVDQPYIDTDIAVAGAEFAGGVAPWSKASQGITAATKAIKGLQTGKALIVPAAETVANITKSGGALGRIGTQAATGAIVGAARVRDEDESFLKNTITGAAFGAGFQAAGEGVNAIAKMAGIGKLNAYLKLKEDLSDMLYKSRTRPEVTRADAERAADIIIKAKAKEAGIESPTAKEYREARRLLKKIKKESKVKKDNIYSEPNDSDIYDIKKGILAKENEVGRTLTKDEVANIVQSVRKPKPDKGLPVDILKDEAPKELSISQILKNDYNAGNIKLENLQELRKNPNTPPELITTIDEIVANEQKKTQPVDILKDEPVVEPEESRGLITTIPEPTLEEQNQLLIDSLGTPAGLQYEQEAPLPPFVPQPNQYLKQSGLSKGDNPKDYKGDELRQIARDNGLEIPKSMLKKSDMIDFIKENINDQEMQRRVQGSEQGREEPGRAVQEQRTGGKEIKGSGILQTQKEITPERRAEILATSTLRGPGEEAGKRSKREYVKAVMGIDVNDEVNTSPTEAEKEAGNYKKAHFPFEGMQITIENPKGSVREGTDTSGKKWSQELKYDYGYIKGTEGPDGDQIDAFFGNNPGSDKVYIVNQKNPRTGKFDEHKVMFGFDNERQARVGYLSNYEKGWKGLGSMVSMSMDEFKTWIKEGNHKKPVKAKTKILYPKQKKTGEYLDLEEKEDTGPLLKKETGIIRPKPKKTGPYLDLEGGKETPPPESPLLADERDIKEADKTLDEFEKGLGKKKEPWEMTRDEYSGFRTLTDEEAKEVDIIKPEKLSQDYKYILNGKKVHRLTDGRFRLYGSIGKKIEHEKAVEQALSEGKIVPEEVLKDYPDLKKTSGEKDVSRETIPELKDTIDAVKFSRVATPEQLKEVKRLHEKYEKQADEIRVRAQKETDITKKKQLQQEHIDMGMKTQVMREILEYQEDPARFDKFMGEETPKQEVPKFKTYDEAQTAIDEYETKLMDQGKTDAEMDKDQYLTKLYDARDSIGQGELEQSAAEISNVINNETNDKELTDRILKNIYNVDPSSKTGQYFAAEYTQKQVKDRKDTREKVFNAVKDDYGRKNNIDMDGIFSEISGLTRKGQEKLLKELTDKAAKIETAVYDYFNPSQKPKSAPESTQEETKPNIPGMVRLDKGGVKPFVSMREFKSGKNKTSVTGKVEVTFPDGKKKVVNKEQIRSYPEQSTKAEESKPAERDKYKVGFHIRDTLVSADKLNTLPDKNVKRLLEIKDEFSKLGYVDFRTEMGPDQIRRMSANQKENLNKKFYDAVGLEAEAKQLLKTESELNQEKAIKERDEIEKELQYYKNRKNQIESFLSKKLESKRDNTTKKEYREVINKIVDLEAQLKGKSKPVFMKEGDTSIPSPKGKPIITMKGVQSTVDRVKAKFPNIGNVNVIQSQSEIPDIIFERAGQERTNDKIFAFYDSDTDSITIVADNMKDRGAVIDALIHEGIGHRGVDSILTKQNRKQLFNMVQRDYRNSEVGKKIIKDYKLDLDNEGDQTTFAREVIAHMAVNEPKASLLDRIISFIKQALRSAGIKIRLTNAEIRNLLRRSAEFARTGRGGVQETGTAFQKQGLTNTQEFKEFFGKSRVVDKKGKPLVVYHGSGVKNIEIFDIKKTGTIQRADWGEGIYFTPAPFMAEGYRSQAVVALDKKNNQLWKEYNDKAKEMGTEPMMASIDLGYKSEKYNELQKYEDRWRANLKELEQAIDKGQVYPAYVALQNPEIYTYGGITEPDLSQWAKDAGKDGIIVQDEDGNIEEVIAFKPEQIKSIYNRGTFDKTDPRISFSKEKVEPEDKKKLNNQFKSSDELLEYLVKETEKQKAKPAPKYAPKPKPAMSGDIYSKNRESVKSQTFFDKIKSELIRVKDEPRRVADQYLGSISTRLGNINPLLKAHLRSFEFKKGTKAGERIKAVEPLLKKIRSMSLDDQIDFDLARKNGDATKLQFLIKKYRLGLEYGKLRKTLDNIYKEAESVGFDIGYKKHYHPRKIKDIKGFLKYFRGQENWSVIDEAIKEKEQQLDRYLDDSEKATLINTLLRGYKSSSISLSKPGQLKEREIEVVWPDINKFYMSSDGALLQYLNEVTNIIEARKIFGKTSNKKGELGFNDDINDTIGDYVLRLLQEGKIKPEQEQELKEIYNARFNEVGTSGGFSIYKNLSYIDTMGSPISAITQIGDLAWALYKNGPIETGKAAVKAVIGKSSVTRKDIGVERIAQEFEDTTKAAKAVTKVFKITGLEKLDAIGKESLISSTFEKARKRANNPKQVDKLREELSYFEDETDQLIEDLQAGNITENVKLYLFNTLSDFQPITLSEMPEKYLTGGNGRIFYMLKTFTLKQFDAFRREAVQKIAKPETRKEGIKNLIKLASAFVVANATADLIKALILGRPIDPEDIVIDNLLRLFGVSKFVTWKAREEGLGTAISRQILPPIKIVDAVTKDIATVGDDKGLETVSSIPIIGKLYYWWFGKGAGKSNKRQKMMLVEKYFKAFASGNDKKRIETIKQINEWNKTAEGDLKINLKNYSKRKKEALEKRNK